MDNAPDFSHVSQFGNPAIIKRQAKTEVLVRDGDTAVLGGIYTRNASVAYQKLPWIADLPIIGWLFKNRTEQDTRDELLVFITPRIVNRQAVAR
jgi:type IV pilus assembly protein PilQ